MLKTCNLILLQLEVSLETVYHAIEFGAKHGIEVILNPAPADPKLNVERISKVTFFTPNETELALLTGMPVESREQIEDMLKDTDATLVFVEHDRHFVEKIATGIIDMS